MRVSVRADAGAQGPRGVVQRGRDLQEARVQRLQAHREEADRVGEDEGRGRAGEDETDGVSEDPLPERRQPVIEAGEREQDAHRDHRPRHRVPHAGQARRHAHDRRRLQARGVHEREPERPRHHGGGGGEQDRVRQRGAEAGHRRGASGGGVARPDAAVGSPARRTPPPAPRGIRPRRPPPTSPSAARAARRAHGADSARIARGHGASAPAPAAPARRAAGGWPAAWPRCDRTCRTTRDRWPRSACGSRRWRRCRSPPALPSWPARCRPPATGAPSAARPDRTPASATGPARARSPAWPHPARGRRCGPADRRKGRTRASSPARRPSTRAGWATPRRGRDSCAGPTAAARRSRGARASRSR